MEDPRPRHGRIVERLEGELDNLRQALAWSLEGRGRPGWDPQPGLRLASALHWFWPFSSRQDEGVQWLELLLAGEAEERAIRSERGQIPLTPERTNYRAKALQVAASCAAMFDENSKAYQFAIESRELYQSLGAEGRLGYTYMRLSSLDLGLKSTREKR
jgi:hypothetical protein